MGTWRRWFLNHEALESSGVAELEIQDKLHIKIQSKNENDRIEALSSLRGYTVDDLQFMYLPLFDMEEIGRDLHKVSTDNISDVKKYAAITIEDYFRYIRNKDQLWMDLIRLASEDDSNVRDSATIAINSVYPLVDNKDKVWAGLIGLVRSNSTKDLWRNNMNIFTNKT